MPVSIGSGLQDTADPLSNDLRVSMEERVTDLDLREAPFTALLMKLPKKYASSFKEEWINIAAGIRRVFCPFAA
jgi:hypothetical protein